MCEQCGYPHVEDETLDVLEDVIKLSATEFADWEEDISESEGEKETMASTVTMTSDMPVVFATTPPRMTEHHRIDTPDAAKGVWSPSGFPCRRRHRHSRQPVPPFLLCRPRQP